jgi:hypothetical protein
MGQSVTQMGMADGTAVTAVFQDRRLERERRTLSAMLGIYCRDRHGSGAGLCAECQGLLCYATVRLQRCRFGPDKPTCARCPVHCYLPDRREQVRAVMRYAGPKMMWRHPWLSVWHLLDKFRKVEGPCR